MSMFTLLTYRETSVNFTNNSVIEILHMRDMITFYLVKPGFFMADRNRNIEIKDDGKQKVFFFYVP